VRDAGESAHSMATGRDLTAAPLYSPALTGALQRLLNLRRQTTMAQIKLPNTPAGSALQGADQSLFDDFLPHLIARLAYRLNSDLIEKLRHEGINVTRWRILAVLAMDDGVTISKIIDRAMMQQPALSRALMNMESEGYVRRGPRRDDARYVEVFLTDKGRSLFGVLNVVVRRRQSRLLKNLSRDEVAAAFALIRRLSRNMAD
jgi:MarR family transcriptional regulator, organic hydroperoxide resistance regulator